MDPVPVTHKQSIHSWTVVLAETMRTGKANSFPENTSIPMRHVKLNN